VDNRDPTGYLQDVVALDGGWYHKVALLGDRTLRSWGMNPFGQLGDGTTTDRMRPVPVVDPMDPSGILQDVTYVDAGWHHTLAVLADGTVRGWGHNSFGQIGDGTTTERHTPVPVVDPSDPTGMLQNVRAIAGGEWHTVALHRDGTLQSWGENGGRLGDGTWSSRLIPGPVLDPLDPTGFLQGGIALSAGSHHTLVIRP
jgi:alpha-tubulin suppressor-like RCC1 family protein